MTIRIANTWTEMNMNGWYYLHTNGDLIYKASPDAHVDIRDSDFARALWPCDPSDRETAWTIVVEALAGGATPSRVKELADKWRCTDEDAKVYAERLGLRLMKDGNAWFASRQDFQNLQESPAGFGERAYEAIADLAKALGYRPSKMWGNSIQMLARRQVVSINL